MTPLSTLIVDDEPDIRLMLRLRLEQANDVAVVGEAASGLDAIREAELCDPEMVIIDLRMPGIDGIETAIRLRERRPELPVILFSAQLDADIYDRAEAAGINACVMKTDLEGLADVTHQIAIEPGDPPARAVPHAGKTTDAANTPSPRLGIH